MSSRAERRRLAREAARLLAMQQGQSHKEHPHPVLLWFRRTGLPALLLGAAASIVTLYFWPSVVLVYAGVLSLVVDLLLDPLFRSRRVTQIICGVALTAFTAAFSLLVVFRAAPLIVRASITDGAYPPGTVLAGIRWTPDIRDLRVKFENDTEQDYERADLHVQIDASILAKGQVGNIPGLVFIENEVQFTRTVIDKEGRKVLIPIPAVQNHYRFRCDKLPRYDSLEIAFAVAAVDVPKIKTVRVNGQYHGGLRVRQIDTTISLR